MKNRNLFRGVVAGAVAGLAATFVMTKYQNLTSGLINSDSSDGNQKSRENETPTTVKAANMITENVFDHKLQKGEKETAGQVMHYLMGGVSGAIYGAANEYTGLAKMGGGFPFGTAVRVIADDVVVPVLGLSKSPLERPLSMHAYALSSHLVYGAVSELVRNAVRKIL